MQLNRYTWMRWVAFLVALLALSACSTNSPQAFTTLSESATLESDICHFGVHLERVGFGPAPVLPDPEGRVFAGYSTRWEPGTPPFACDRLHQTMHHGVFHFNVRALSAAMPAPFRGAILQIPSFTPAGGGIEIVDAVPWGLPFGTGWISSSAPRHTCRFRVMRATEAWTPGPRGFGGAAVVTKELQTGRATFMAPITDTVAFDVTHEVAQWLSGEAAEFGFAIVPDDSSILSKANNVCQGLFTVQLVIRFEE